MYFRFMAYKILIDASPLKLYGGLYKFIIHKNRERKMSTHKTTI